MKDKDKTKEQLRREWVELRQRIGELEAAETEHRQMEEALRESENQFRSIVEQSSEGIALINEKGVILNQLTERHLRRVDGTPCALHMVFPIKTHKGFMIDAIIRDITERQRAEKEVRKSEEKYSNLFYHSNDGIFLHDLEGNIIDVNQKVLDLFGYTRSEILSLKIPELHPDEALEMSRWAFETISQDGLVSFEIDFKKKSGKVFPAEVSSSLFEISGRRVIQGIVRDITERKRVEEALRESEEKYRALVEQSLQGLVIAQGIPPRLVFANSTMAKILGYTVEELLSLSPEEVGALVHPEDQAVFFQRYRDRLAGKPAGPRYEVRSMRRDGAVRWVEMFASRIEYGGKPAVQTAFADITQRKRAERLLRALNQASLAMGQAFTPEEIFAAVAKELKELGFSCMVFPTDESRSRLFTKYLSYEIKALKAAEKLVGLQHEDFSFPIENVDLYREVVWEKKAVFVENAEDIVRQILPDFAKGLAGQIVSMLKVPKHIPTPLIVEDEVIGVFSVQSDDLIEDDVLAITAFAHQMAAAWRKAQLMQDLQNSLEELKRTQARLVRSAKLAAIGQLAASVAHELNNPLNSIVGFTHLLLKEVDDDNPMKEDLQIIEREAARTRVIVRGLLDFARQREPRLEPADVNEIVRSTMTLVRHQAKGAGVTIKESYDETLPPVSLDADQIKQVFLNMMTNAIQAMPEGGELEVVTAYRSWEMGGAGCVAVEFHDTGTGISAEDLSRIFDPFFTTKEEGQGTGLGLSISYGIMERHGGWIEVETKVGRGSTFRVILPVAERQGTAPNAESRS